MKKKSASRYEVLTDLIQNLSLEDLLENWYEAKGGKGEFGDRLPCRLFDSIDEIEYWFNQMIADDLIEKILVK